MSDMENDKFASMEEEEEIGESFSKLTADTTKTELSPSMRTRAKKGSLELRHRRQKYCERWEEEFPWLKSDKADESLGICTICDKRLVCKKSHLERHQSSFKHQRIAGFDVISTKPDNPFAVFLDNDEKRDSDDYELEHLESEEFTTVPKPSTKMKIKGESSKNLTASTSVKSVVESSISQHPSYSKEHKVKLNRLKLLKRIDRDRNELNEYYYARQRALSNNVASSKTPQQRDSFDLFFESVSASVKSLPPKLSYEVKSKISQLLSEFELRALCEKEAVERASREVTTTLAPVLVAPAFEDHAKQIQVSTSIDASTIPHLVYTFQQKHNNNVYLLWWKQLRRVSLNPSSANFCQN